MRLLPCGSAGHRADDLRRIPLGGATFTDWATCGLLLAEIVDPWPLTKVEQSRSVTAFDDPMAVRDVNEQGQVPTA
jgi:hypothetical protein